MPRIKNERPTTIYWLYDTRSEILRDHPNGKPFYCGKTVCKVAHRVRQHESAVRTYPLRRLSVRLKECAGAFEARPVEIVPCTGDWAARECFWIADLRATHPDCVNISAGGQGVPGLVHSAEAKARVSRGNKGRVRTPEHRASLIAALRNRIISVETRQKISKINKGKTCPPVSIETRRKISAAHKGRVLSAETRARMSAAQMGNKNQAGLAKSPEHRAKIAETLRGRCRPPEVIAKMSKSLTGRKLSETHRAKISERFKGRSLSPEHRAKVSAARKGIVFSPEHRAALSRARRAHLAKRA